MKTLSIREVRQALSHIEELIAEDEIIVTRRGRPVARLMPVEGPPPPGDALPDHAELRASMPRLTRSSAGILRDDRDER